MSIIDTGDGRTEIAMSTNTHAGMRPLYNNKTNSYFLRKFKEATGLVGDWATQSQEQRASDMDEAYENWITAQIVLNQMYLWDMKRPIGNSNSRCEQRIIRLERYNEDWVFNNVQPNWVVVVDSTVDRKAVYERMRQTVINPHAQEFDPYRVLTAGQAATRESIVGDVDFVVFLKYRASSTMCSLMPPEKIAEWAVTKLGQVSSEFSVLLLG